MLTSTSELAKLTPSQLPLRVTPASKDHIANVLNPIVQSANHFVRTLTHSNQTFFAPL